MKSKTCAELTAVCVFLTACGGGHHQRAEPVELPPVDVTIGQAKKETVPVFAEVVGTVRPRKEAQVSAKVTGRILELHAVPGKRVKKGETLAELDAGELKAGLERAEATLDQANRDLARYKSLRDSGAATQAEWEQVESRQQVAAATVKETQVMLDNATITAPFDGTVTRKLMEPGDLAAPGRLIFAMEDPSLLRLQINVAESLAGQVSLGDKFRVEVAGADAEMEGEVSEIAPSADVGSRTFSIKLDLPPDESLRAGQFGRAFLPRAGREAIDVPASAVVSRGQMDYVFVVNEENVARLRIVRVAGHGGEQIEVLAGLDGGETIVLSPPAELRDGQPVTTATQQG